MTQKIEVNGNTVKVGELEEASCPEARKRNNRQGERLAKKLPHNLENLDHVRSNTAWFRIEDQAVHVWKHDTNECLDHVTDISMFPNGDRAAKIGVQFDREWLMDNDD